MEKAERILESLLRERYEFDLVSDRHPDPLFHLGRIAALRGQHEQAVAFMQRSLVRAPGDPVVLAHLACLTGETAYATRVFRYFDDMDAAFYLGRACLETGQTERSAGYLNQLAISLPDYQRGLIYLAAALGASGRYKEAAGLYLSTVGTHPKKVIIEDYIVTVFEQWAKEGSPEALYWYGVVLRQYGHFSDALQVFGQAAAAGSKTAAAELNDLRSRMDMVLSR